MASDTSLPAASQDTDVVMADAEPTRTQDNTNLPHNDQTSTASSLNTTEAGEALTRLVKQIAAHSKSDTPPPEAVPKLVVAEPPTTPAASKEDAVGEPASVEIQPADGKLWATLKQIDPAALKEDYFDDEGQVWDIEGLQDDIRLHEREGHTVATPAADATLYLEQSTSERASVLSDAVASANERRAFAARLAQTGVSQTDTPADVAKPSTTTDTPTGEAKPAATTDTPADEASDESTEEAPVRPSPPPANPVAVAVEAPAKKQEPAVLRSSEAPLNTLAGVKRKAPSSEPDTRSESEPDTGCFACDTPRSHRAHTREKGCRLANDGYRKRARPSYRVPVWARSMGITGEQWRCPGKTAHQARKQRDKWRQNKKKKIKEKAGLPLNLEMTKEMSDEETDDEAADANTQPSHPPARPPPPPPKAMSMLPPPVQGGEPVPYYGGAPGTQMDQFLPLGFDVRGMPHSEADELAKLTLDYSVAVAENKRLEDMINRLRSRVVRCQLKFPEGPPADYVKKAEELTKQSEKWKEGKTATSTINEQHAMMTKSTKEMKRPLPGSMAAMAQARARFLATGQLDAEARSYFAPSSTTSDRDNKRRRPSGYSRRPSPNLVDIVSPM